MKKILLILIGSVIATVGFATYVNAESNSQSSYSPWAIFGSDMKPKNSVWNAILPSGKLGIGTTTPWASLSVVGNSDLGNYAQAGYFNATNTTATSNFSGDIKIGTSLSAIKTDNYTANLLSGVTNSASSVGYNFDTINYQTTVGSTIAKFSTGGNEVMRISNEGDAGFSSNQTIVDFSHNQANNRFLYPYGVEFRIPAYGFAVFKDDPTLGSNSDIFLWPQAGTVGVSGTQLIFGLNSGATNLYYTTQGGPFIGGETYGFVPDTLSAMGAIVSNSSSQKWGSIVQARDKRHWMGNASGFPIGPFTPESSIYYDGSNLNLSPRDVGSMADASSGDLFVNTGNMGIVSTTTVGSELLTNSTMTGTTGWTYNTSWTNNGTQAVRSANATLGTLTQALSGFTVGAEYVLSFTIGGSTGVTDEFAGITPSITGIRKFGIRGVNGVYTYTFIATATSGTLTFTPSTLGAVLTLDNVSLKKSTAGNLSVAGNGYFGNSYTFGNTGAGTTTPYSKLTVWGGGIDGARAFEVVNNASTTNAFIKDDGTAYFRGNVGVGTTSPQGLLSVGPGTATVPQILLAPGATTTEQIPGSIEYASDSHFYFTNGSRKGMVMVDCVKTNTTTAVNTTTETEVFTCTLPANALHVDERAILSVDGQYSNASASDDWTMRLKFNGVTVRTLSRVGGNITDAGWELTWKGSIRSAGVSGAFVDTAILTDGMNMYSVGTTTTSTINTTIANTVSVTIQWANAKLGNTFSATGGDVTYKH